MSASARRGKLATNNENRSWDRVETSVKTANVVTNTTRLNIECFDLTHRTTVKPRLEIGVRRTRKMLSGVATN